MFPSRAGYLASELCLASWNNPKHWKSNVSRGELKVKCNWLLFESWFCLNLLYRKAVPT